MNNDLTYMRHALALAERGRGLTKTNPLVGAVIVKNNTIIAEGYHARFGGPHAEVKALRKAGKKVRGATLYVTLEPCSTYGKTPPCTEAILKSGIKRVMIAMRDPNPVNRNNGIRMLRKHGVAVTVGILSDEAVHQNKAFITNMTCKRPFIILKMAQSLDGKIATRNGDSRWITSKAARVEAHRLRSQVDAILVGKNTVVRDNPSLTVRHVRSKKQPLRVICDSNASLPLARNVFGTRSRSGTLLVTTQKGAKKATRFTKKGVEILVIKQRNNRIDMAALMNVLLHRNVSSILVEGGGELAASLLKSKLIDEVCFFIAPKIIGGRNAVNSISGIGAQTIAESIVIKNMNVTLIGCDYMVQGKVVYGSKR